MERSMADGQRTIPLEVAPHFYQLLTNFKPCNPLEKYTKYINSPFIIEVGSGCGCADFENELFSADLSALTSMITSGRCPHSQTAYHEDDEKGGANHVTFYPIHVVAACTSGVEEMKLVIEAGADIYRVTKPSELTVLEIVACSTNHTRELLLKWLVYERGFKVTYPEPNDYRASCPNMLKRLCNLFTTLVTRRDLAMASCCVDAVAGLVGYENIILNHLSQAVLDDDCEMVQWCMNYNKTPLNNIGYPSLLHSASSKEMAELLMEGGADPTFLMPHVDPSRVAYPLVHHVSKHNWNIAAVIADKFPGSLNLLGDEAGYTVLHQFAIEGGLSEVQFCIEHGADQSLPASDGNTPLALAAFANSAECVDYLLQLGGSDINTSDKDGDTALIYATFHGNSNITRSLLKGGADPNLTNYRVVSPLWCSVYARSLDCVNQLLSLNVTTDLASRGTNMFSYHGEYIYDVPVTPIFVAIHHQSIDIIKVLMSSGCFIHQEKYSVPNFDMYVNDWERENKNWLDTILSEPPTLLWWCKRVIRQSLPVSFQMSKLTLPTHLKSYLNNQIHI